MRSQIGSKAHFSFFLLVVFIATLSLSLTACEGGLGSLLVSNAQENEIGVSVDQEIEATYAILDDSDPVAVWARELVAPLEANSVQFRDPAEINGFKVEVIADNELVNAFAAPGGYTYLSTGLLLQASSCAEIAGVMGHELAHVTQRHSANMIAENFAVGTVADFLFGGSLTGEATKLIYGFLSSTSFSQDNESESDEVGAQISHGAGYNPYGLVDFFETLLALEEASGGLSTPQFLSSHPATKDRIAAITAQINQRYGSEVVRGETQTYDCVGTQLQLADVKQRIQSGSLQVRPGTGGGS